SEEAQRFAGVLKHDLILMDMELPDSSVFYLAGQIRKIQPQVPLIAQLGSGNQNDLQKVKEGVFDDYLKMPTSRPLINAVVNRFL
ncbi:MAG: hypothetical protein ACOC4R_01895, partial [Bacteroidota bacterium]